MVAGIILVLVMIWIFLKIKRDTPQSIKDQKNAPAGMFRCKVCRNFKIEERRAHPNGSKCISCWNM